MNQLDAESTALTSLAGVHSGDPSLSLPTPARCMTSGTPTDLTDTTQTLQAISWTESFFTRCSKHRVVVGGGEHERICITESLGFMGG